MKELFNQFNKDIYNGRQFFGQNICINRIITEITLKILEDEEISELEKYIYKFSKDLFLKCDPILDNDSVCDEFRQEVIDEHNKDINTYSLSNFYLDYKIKVKSNESKEILQLDNDKRILDNELDKHAIADSDSNENDKSLKNDDISIYSTTLFPLPNKKNTIQLVIIKNKREFEIHTYNYELELDDIKRYNTPFFFLRNSLYEDCFAYYLSKFHLLEDINNFLTSQEQYFNSLEKYLMFLRTLLLQYQNDFPNFISKKNEKQIKFWIKLKSKVLNSPKEQENIILESEDTFPQLGMPLSASQKAHLFNFLFYFRNKIKTVYNQGTYPSHKQFSENMQILQGKKYYKTNSFEKSINGRLYRDGDANKLEDTTAIINYLIKSENKHLLYEFSTYCNQYLKQKD